MPTKHISNAVEWSQIPGGEKVKNHSFPTLNTQGGDFASVSNKAHLSTCKAEIFEALHDHLLCLARCKCPRYAVHCTTTLCAISSKRPRYAVHCTTTLCAISSKCPRYAVHCTTTLCAISSNHTDTAGHTQQTIYTVNHKKPIYFCSNLTKR